MEDRSSSRDRTRDPKDFPGHDLPVVSRDAIASVSVDQMQGLDRVALASGLSLLQMMENAGIRLSEVARGFMELEQKRQITVLSGDRNNGGGALAAARHLSNRGADVTVVLDRPLSEPTDTRRLQLDVLQQAVTGTLLLADISIPAGVYRSLGLARPDVFIVSPIVEIAQ